MKININMSGFSTFSKDSFRNNRKKEINQFFRLSRKFVMNIQLGYS
jgi:hypothetical protein